MNERKKLKQIVMLFGGVNKLGKEIGLNGSGVSRRINGEIQLSVRDWICIKAAIMKRINELTLMLDGKQ